MNLLEYRILENLWKISKKRKREREREREINLITFLKHVNS